MEHIFKFISAVLFSTLAIFTPITPLIWCVVLFIGVDFVTGVTASHTIAHREGQEWYFESCEAWRTLYKLGFTLVAISMAWLMELYILNFVDLHLSKIFTGAVCGVEFWSFLENASQISDAPYFRWMRKYLHRRVRKELER